MTATAASICYRFAHYELQPNERRLLASGKMVHLGAHAFDLLVALAEQSGHLVTKDELLERVWGKTVVEENTLQTHISTLRKVLGPDSIATVSGHGYRFALQVTPLDALPAPAPVPAPASKHNLPHDLTSFIGREKEIAELSALLGGARLLTLTGSGGCGKTRLAIELAKQQARAYADGAWLVELAPLTDATLLPQTVANVLGIEEKVGARITDTIAEKLASCALLLVLDNAEHLIEACARLAESLLRRCERLIILVTSRERLSVTGELVYRVPSLSVPDGKSDTSPESIAGYESVRLFIERVRLQLPHFAITPQNSATIASICRRLDGVALALELAAPRVRTLSVDALSSGLDRRFELLTEGSRTALPRHRTLRSLIDWSYDLLRNADKAMLRNVSVFAGGWTLKAAEHVLDWDAAGSSRVLDLLASLVDKNLIFVEARDGATRYGMLETVRDYARDRLREANEQAQVHDRHVAFFLALAEQAHQEKAVGNAATLLDALEIELDNFRSALWWSSKSRTGEASVRLAGALCWFWLERGYVTEGRRWLSATLAKRGAKCDPIAYTTALRGATVLAQRQSDHIAARRLAEEGLAIWAKSADRHGIAVSCQSLGLVAHSQGDYVHAREYYEKALALLRELDDMAAVSVVQSSLGQMSISEGRIEEAGIRLSESVALARELGDYRLPLALASLGQVIHRQGDPERARSLLEEALAGSRKTGNRAVSALALVHLSEIANDCGDPSGVHSLLREALVIQSELGNVQAICHVLSLFVEFTLTSTDPEVAARFWGLMQRMGEEFHWNEGSAWRLRRERQMTTARVELGDDAFEVAWKEGRTMLLDQAVDFALNVLRAGPASDLA